MVDMSNLLSHDTDGVMNLVDDLSDVVDLLHNFSSLGDIGDLDDLGNQMSNLNLQHSDLLDQFNEFLHVFDDNSLLLFDDSQIDISMKTVVVRGGELSDVLVDSGNDSSRTLIVIRVLSDHSQSSSQLSDDTLVVVSTSVDRSDLSNNSQLSDDLGDLVNLSDTLFDDLSESDNLLVDMNVMNMMDMMVVDKDMWDLDVRGDVVNSVLDAHVFLCDLFNLFLEDNNLLSDNNSLWNWNLCDFNLQDVDTLLDLSDDLDKFLFFVDQFVNDLLDVVHKWSLFWSNWEDLISLVLDNPDCVFHMGNLVGDSFDHLMELFDFMLDDNFLVFINNIDDFLSQFLDSLSDNNSSLDEFDYSSSQSFDDVSFSMSSLSDLSHSVFRGEWSRSSDGVDSLSNDSDLSDQLSDSPSQDVDLVNNDSLLEAGKFHNLVSQYVDLLSDDLDLTSDFSNLLSQLVNDGVFNDNQLSWSSSEFRFSNPLDRLFDDVDLFDDLVDGVFQDSDLVNEMGSTFNWLLVKLNVQLFHCFLDNNEFVMKLDDSLGKSLDNPLFNVSKFLRIPLTLSHNKLFLLSLSDQSLGELDLFLGENSSSFSLFGSSLNHDVPFQHGSSLLLGDGH